MTHYAHEATKKNAISVVMNYRGIEADLLTTRMFCATDTDDLEFVVNHIKQRYPQHSVFVVATSLGCFKIFKKKEKSYGKKLCRF